MSATTNKLNGSPRERIVEVALDLFYQQGYRATGVNEVIEKSGVAKATFYKHFPSKEALGIEYLKLALEQEVHDLNTSLEKISEPEERLLQVILWLKKWAKETNLRGCAFLHMVAEEPNWKSGLRKPGIDLYEGTRQRIKELALELIASDTEKYRHLDAEVLANDMVLLFAGSIALSEIYHDDWPIDRAEEAARRMISS